MDNDASLQRGRVLGGDGGRHNTIPMAVPVGVTILPPNIAQNDREAGNVSETTSQGNGQKIASSGEFDWYLQISMCPPAEGLKD